MGHILALKYHRSLEFRDKTNSSMEGVHSLGKQRWGNLALRSITVSKLQRYAQALQEKTGVLSSVVWLK
jgi:hypothetical protein